MDARIKKGDQTKAAILETARSLFAEKGYSTVTMKDFCDRHQLSRGGLYRHFASTKEIFTAMLEADKDQAASELEAAIEAGIPARQMFARFVREQKLEIQQGGGRLSIAVYEFCAGNPDQKGYLDERFAAAVEILRRLIRYGQARQEFRAGNAEEMARHIVLYLEGFKVSSGVLNISEEMLDNQMRFLQDLVVIQD